MSIYVKIPGQKNIPHNCSKCQFAREKFRLVDQFLDREGMLKCLWFPSFGYAIKPEDKKPKWCPLREL